jgi:hypothetical protein
MKYIKAFALGMIAGLTVAYALAFGLGAVMPPDIAQLLAHALIMFLCPPVFICLADGPGVDRGVLAQAMAGAMIPSCKIAWLIGPIVAGETVRTPAQIIIAGLVLVATAAIVCILLHCVFTTRRACVKT